VPEHEEAMCDEQLTACLQHLYEQFGEQIGTQIRALSEQFTAMSGLNGRCCRPNPCYAEEEDECSMEDKPANPFAEHKAWCQMPHPLLLP
jgi:hypothetical protein